MSAGFPNRPTRNDYGPPLVNVRPVTQPDKELGAEPMNLAFWQMAGAGRTLPMALIIYDGVNEDVLLKALAFDPSQKLPESAVTVVRDSTGQYTITFQASYADESGRQVAYLPRAAMVMVNGSALNLHGVCEVDGQTVVVYVANTSAVPTNAVVVITVW